LQIASANVRLYWAWIATHGCLTPEVMWPSESPSFPLARVGSTTPTPPLGCLRPYIGSVGSHAASPCELLNDRYPRPVNASISGMLTEAFPSSRGWRSARGRQGSALEAGADEAGRGTTVAEASARRAAPGGRTSGRRCRAGRCGRRRGTGRDRRRPAAGPGGRIPPGSRGGLPLSEDPGQRVGPRAARRGSDPDGLCRPSLRRAKGSIRTMASPKIRRGMASGEARPPGVGWRTASGRCRKDRGTASAGRYLGRSDRSAEVIVTCPPRTSPAAVREYHARRQSAGWAWENKWTKSNAGRWSPV
jgi:hypothetical protein